MIRDGYITERRLAVLRDLPWMLPATMVLRFTEEDLDSLDMAPDKDAYWRRLHAIVSRLERSE